MNNPAKPPRTEAGARQLARIFLCGDVMTGRGIDQVLPHPCDPLLHESYVRSATDYVRFAEGVNGRIPRAAKFSYVWGAALQELSRVQPDVRVINLETSITRSGMPAPKGINYRMSPENAACLVSADLDCCVLANNHILDWGRAGLIDTLETLERLRIESTGAGIDLDQARAPAILAIPDRGRVIVFAAASVTSGVPVTWAAKSEASGVNLLTDLSSASVARIAHEVACVRQPGDVVILSIHWGPNWGYKVPEEERRFAHELVDRAAVSIVHGHSSHHPKAMEVYRNRLILYGCGDFLNDYEGIRGYEEFLDDLTLMYFAEVDLVSGDLVSLEMVPLQIRRFQLAPASSEDTEWLLWTLDRECRRFGARMNLEPDGRLTLSWRDDELVGSDSSALQEGS
jgi:poly-gamma-glutamate capsule biosynthesis protein CapA/YwtB (metallophosphatase superfamily)